MQSFATSKKVAARNSHSIATAGMSWQTQPPVVRQVLRGPALQPKLTIGAPNDAYEREADRIADRVMRLSDAEVQASLAPPTVQRLCSECEEELRTKPQGGGSNPSAPVLPIVHDVLRSPGRPLDAETRVFFEPRFGRDFGDVRIHTDAQATASAQAVNALAYTVGSDVVIGEGSYSPGSIAGKSLLAHELTHVVQQSVGHAPRSVARRPADAEKDKPKAPPKPPKCHTGCAQRWGQDTTCSKWGFFLPEQAEQGEGKEMKSIPCCNSWPWSLEDYARRHLGLNGAASCPVQHEKEIATITYGGKDVQVLCSDTISNKMVGETKSANACSGKIKLEVIEMSPKAMQDLSGQVANALHVRVCYSGSKKDLCLHNGPGKAFRPEIKHCLTKGCTPQEGIPALKDTGWPRV